MFTSFGLVTENKELAVLGLGRLKNLVASSTTNCNKENHSESKYLESNVLMELTAPQRPRSEARGTYNTLVAFSGLSTFHKGQIPA